MRKVNTLQQAIDCPAEDLDAALVDAGDYDTTVDHMRRVGRMRGWSDEECAKRTVLASSLVRRDMLRQWMDYMERHTPVLVVRQ